MLLVVDDIVWLMDKAHGWLFRLFCWFYGWELSCGRRFWLWGFRSWITCWSDCISHNVHSWRLLSSHSRAFRCLTNLLPQRCNYTTFLLSRNTSSGGGNIRCRLLFLFSASGRIFNISLLLLLRCLRHIMQTFLDCSQFFDLDFFNLLLVFGFSCSEFVPNIIWFL